MKILFDYISIQGTINGGSEYTKIVLSELVKLKNNNKDIQIYALYDSQISLGRNNCFLSDENFDGIYDIHKIRSIANLIDNENFTTFFIGILQRLIKYDLTNIKCHVVAVLHDISYYEIMRSKLYLLNPQIKSERIKESVKKILSKVFPRFNSLDYFFNKNSTNIVKKNFDIVTVSNFSKSSITYNLPFMRKKNIYVLYSPLRKEVAPKIISIIKNIINLDQKYFILLSSNRWLKNTQMAMDVLRDFCVNHPEYYVVTTGSCRQQFEKHISLPYVSDEELAYLLQNANALIYPTLFEGFGYPPIEAMRYGTPVLCSNFTSLPEIVGDAGIYFSPIYRSDLYNKLELFINMDKNLLKEKSLSQYNTMIVKQKKDLQKLIDLIVK